MSVFGSARMPMSEIENRIERLRSAALAAVVAAACLLGLSPQAPAHPMSQASVVVDALTNKIVAQMTIMTDDVALYQKIEPGEDQRLPGDQLQEGAKKHAEYLSKHFSIRGENGEPLQGKLVEMDASQIPKEGLYPAELMQFGVIYRFDYEVEKPQDFLTISQTLGGEDGAIAEVVDLMVLHSGVWFEEPTKVGMKSPHSVKFDWQKGPPEQPKNWRELRKRREARKAERLGISSYSGLYSYIYIEPFELRHEVLIPLITFETLAPLKRAEKDFISVEEQEKAKRTIEEFFRTHNPVEIDGIAVQPVVQRLEFYGLDFRDFAQTAEKKRISIYQARLGVILTYSVKGYPNHVKMTWDAFNRNVPFVKSTYYAYDGAPENTYFEPIDPEFEWKSEVAREAPTLATVPVPEPPRMILAPMVSLFLFAAAPILFLLARRDGRFDFKTGMSRAGLAAGLAALCWPLAQREIRDPFHELKPPDLAERKAIFAALHGNIYRAFDYKNESDVYDTLEQSIGGSLLTDIYLQIQKGLKMQEQGGAIAKVREVKLVSVGSSDDAGIASSGGFVAPCSWTVRGTVEHWGHIHTRENEYEAVFHVEPVAGQWKITGMELRNEKRLKFETGLRGVDV